MILSHTSNQRMWVSLPSTSAPLAHAQHYTCECFMLLGYLFFYGGGTIHWLYKYILFSEMVTEWDHHYFSPKNPLHVLFSW